MEEIKVAKKRKRKISIKNFSSDLVVIFKAKLDKKGYCTWKEFTDDIGVDNSRAFVDFFMGKQCLSKEVLKKAFQVLEIPMQLLEIYTEPVIKYKIKMNK